MIFIMLWVATCKYFRITKFMANSLSACRQACYKQKKLKNIKK